MEEIKNLFCGTMADQLEKNSHAIAALLLQAWDKYGEPVDLPGPDAVIDPVIRASMQKATGPMLLALAKHLRDLSATNTSDADAA